MALALALVFTVLSGVREYDRGGARRAVLPGFVLGVLAALTLAVLKRQTGWVTREFYNLGILWPMIPATIVFMAIFPTPQNRLAVKAPATLWLGAFLIALWVAYGLPDLFIYPLDFGVGLDSIFNVDYLVRWTGYLAGLTLLSILALGLASQARAVPQRLLRFFLLASFLVLLGLVALKATQIMTVRGMLPRSRKLTRAVIFFLERDNFFLYAQMAIWGGLALVQMVRSRLTRPFGANPALVRKMRAELRFQFSLGVLVLASFAVFLLSVTALKAYQERGPKIDEPLAVVANNGLIELDLAEVSDGKLHRRQFMAKSGVATRFIVIRKSETAYGVGLDACDICGQTGYYQRGDEVICKLCDVVMNKVTIGFPGGCNPVPLDFKIQGGKLVIEAESLEKETRRFE
jgi:uncharacterized membrane protein